MNELLLQKVDGLLREHAVMRGELELYRRLFDALIETEPVAVYPGDQARWAYRQTPDADRAVERVLDYRYRVALDAPARRMPARSRVRSASRWSCLLRRKKRQPHSRGGAGRGIAATEAEAEFRAC